jgi:hypothetical protein
MGETTMMVSDIRGSGEPSILLPTAASLVVAGVVGYVVLRRSSGRGSAGGGEAQGGG